MSHTIEYDHVFLVSQEGITPCWLAGDNNVTTGSGKYERRVRRWSVFLNILGATPQELEARIERLIGDGSDTEGEFWRRPDGKWMTNGGLRRWIRNGCRRAFTIEDVLDANGLLSYQAYIQVNSREKSSVELREYIHNTEELDRWIRSAKALISDMKMEGCQCFPVIQFSYDEPVRKPLSAKKKQDLQEVPDQQVLIKQGKTYLVGWEPAVRGHSVSWTHDPKKAKPIPMATAQELLAPGSPYRSLLRNSKIVSTSVTEAPWNAVIRLTQESGEFYVCKITGRRLQYTPFIKGAKHYRDTASAKAAIKRLEGRFPQVFNYEVCVDEEKQ